MNSYTIFGPEKWEKYFIDQVFQYLIDNNHEAFIKDKMAFKLDITNGYSNWYGAIRKYIIFQNNMTKQFFIIDHSDQFDYFVEDIVSHPLCVGILKCQYRKGSYIKCEDKISSFTYGVKEKKNYFNFRDNKKNIIKENGFMYFKGNECGGRMNILKMLVLMGLINYDYGFRDGLGNRNLKISQDQYLTNMMKSKIILSLPGIGNCCHREIEAFGLGIPVLMPPLKNQYYNDLIPNEHYISIDDSIIGDHKIKEYSKFEEKIFCNLIKCRYKETIDDDKLLRKISDNAMRWFDENILFPNNIRCMENILLKRFNYIL